MDNDFERNVAFLTKVMPKADLAADRTKEAIRSISPPQEGELGRIEQETEGIAILKAEGKVYESKK